MLHDPELADPVIDMNFRIPQGIGRKIPLVIVTTIRLINDAEMICLNNSEMLEC